MKTTLLTILGFILGLSLYGQAYQPMIRSNTFWDVHDGDGSQICGVSGGGRYFFQGDSTWGALQYQKLYRYPMVTLNSGPFCPPFAFEGSVVQFAGLYREDVIERKLYMVDPSFQTEVLLFDFSLQAGDTLKNITIFPGTTFLVDSVGNLTLGDGISRKIFYLNNNEFYVESIGGSVGFFNWPVQAIGFWGVSVCVTENGIHLYCNGYDGFVGVQEQEKNSTFKVFTNAAQGKLFILGNGTSNALLRIYDGSGKLCISRNIQHETEIIDISALRANVYFYRIEAHGQRLSGKFIVERSKGL